MDHETLVGIATENSVARPSEHNLIVALYLGFSRDGDQMIQVVAFDGEGLVESLYVFGRSESGIHIHRSAVTVQEYERVDTVAN